MSWRRRFRARLRQKLHEFKVRLRGARAGWRDPQSALAPAWRDPQSALAPAWNPRMTSGTRWNHDLLFTQNRSVLGVFLEVDNELLHDSNVAAAKVANQARAMARYATQLEVERLASR